MINPINPLHKKIVSLDKVLDRMERENQLKSGDESTCNKISNLLRELDPRDRLDNATNIAVTNLRGRLTRLTDQKTLTDKDDDWITIEDTKETVTPQAASQGTGWWGWGYLTSKTNASVASQADTKETAAPQAASTDTSWWSYVPDVSAVAGRLVGTASQLPSIATNAVQTVVNLPQATITYFSGYNHPWKQKKYEIPLKELYSALINQNISLQHDETKDTSDQFIIKGHKILDILQEASKGDENYDYRGNYYTLIDELRDTIAIYRETYSNNAQNSSDNTQNPEVNRIWTILKAVCLTRYTGIEMYSFCENLITKTIAAGAKALEDSKNEGIAEKVKASSVTPEDFEALNSVPEEWRGRQASIDKGKAQGTLNFYFDPARQQNVPFVLGSIPMEKEIKLLRMGVPTIQNASSTTVDPIWETAIEAMDEGRVHLYISFQNDIPKIFNDESARHEALKKMHERFPKKFQFAVLANDSNFYHQKEGYNINCTTENFKKQFCDVLLKNAEGFYFPENWRQDVNFNLGIQDVIDSVASTCFPDNDSLTVEERKIFIEISYAFIMLYLMSYTEADTVNGTCKDAIDRAMKTNSILMHIVAIASGKGQDEETQKQIKVLTHAPAFMVKKQAIIHSRRERLLPVLEFLNNNEVQQRIIQFFNNPNPISKPSQSLEFNVVKRPNQDFADLTLSS